MLLRPWIFMCLPFFSSGQQAEIQKCLHYPEGEVKRHFYVDERELPLRIEVSKRSSHYLLSHILGIILHEILGHPRVYLIDELSGSDPENATTALQRISTCQSPTNCSKQDVNGPKVMINLEVWLEPSFDMEKWIATGRIDDCGPLGPIERSGWHVEEYVVDYFRKLNKMVIDHYSAFQSPEVAAYFDLKGDEDIRRIMHQDKNCSVDECGDFYVYEPLQCTQNDVKCATLLVDFPESTENLLKHQITKFKLLVNIAWVGDFLENIVEARTLERKQTLFFHRRQTLLSSFGKFVRVAFPDCEDEASVCDFEVGRVEKVVWSRIKTNAPQAFYVLREMQLDQIEYIKLLRRHDELSRRGHRISEVACEWMKEESSIWNKWIPSDLKNKTTLYIGGIFPMEGTYWKRDGIIKAASMAAAAVNKNTSVLSNYKLEILEQDGQCRTEQELKSFINFMSNSTYRTMVGILGPACSRTVEPIAGIAKYYNTIIVSYSAEGVLFSNQEKYPYFFRTIPENNQFGSVYMELFKTLGYQSIAAVSEHGQRYTEYLSQLQDAVQSLGMSFITNRKFPRGRRSSDMTTYLKDLKTKGVKVIIGDFYDYTAQSIMCSAYQLGMTAANGFVWFLPLWLSDDWFKVANIPGRQYGDVKRIKCSTTEMIEAINGHMSVTYKFYADNDSYMQEGKTVREWIQDYRGSASKEQIQVSPYGGYAYDAVWAYALALDTLFKEDISHVTTLHTTKTTKRLAELLNQTQFNGVTGSLHFAAKNRTSDLLIWQWVNFSSQVIGTYRSSIKKLELNESKIVWLMGDGKKPIDDVTSKKVLEDDCIIEFLQKILNAKCESAVMLLIVLGATSFSFIFITAAMLYKRRYESRLKYTESRMKELGLIFASGPLALDEWEMPRTHIAINRKLGEGAFGAVYGGEAFFEKKGWIEVAVKTLKYDSRPEEKIEFLSEAQIMKDFDHVNIVKLIGVCTTSEPVYTVMELIPYGDLKTFLINRRNLVLRDDRMYSEVSDRRLTNMALDIARGLTYLANLKYVHRDLACRNCLVTASNTVKIADFGLCRAMYDSDYYRFNKRCKLPIRWMAPESINDGLFSPMSDVWSYGVVLYEIITFGAYPYQGVSNNEILELMKQHYTLRIPEGIKPALCSLLRRCWARLPRARPQAADIVGILGTNSELISPCLDVSMKSEEIKCAKEPKFARIDVHTKPEPQSSHPIESKPKSQMQHMKSEEMKISPMSCVSPVRRAANSNLLKSHANFTSELHIGYHHRSRINSLSSMWQGRKGTTSPVKNLFGDIESLQMMSKVKKGSNNTELHELKFSNKISFHQSFENITKANLKSEFMNKTTCL